MYQLNNYNFIHCFSSVTCQTRLVWVRETNAKEITMAMLISFVYGMETDEEYSGTHVIGSLLNWLTESLRLVVPDSSNLMMSLAGSGFKMEEDHLNI